MILSMSGQARLFLLTVAIGLGAGLLYDAFRLMRQYIKQRDILTHAQDLIFWLIVAAVMFYIFLNYYFGQIHGFTFLGAGLGMLLYFTLLSRYFMRMGRAVVDFIAKALQYLANLLMMPFRAFFNMLKPPVRHIKGKINQFIRQIARKVKKRLQILRKYATIKLAAAKRDLRIILKKI